MGTRLKERCIGIGANCRGTVNHHDEKGEPSCCECWPLAFEDARVPPDLRCRHCPQDATDGPSSPAQPQQQAQGYQPSSRPAGAAPAQPDAFEWSLTSYADALWFAYRRRGGKAAVIPVFREILRDAFRELTSLRSPASAPAATADWRWNNITSMLGKLADTLHEPAMAAALESHMRSLLASPAAPAATVAVAEIEALVAELERRADAIDPHDYDNGPMVWAFHQARELVEALLPASPATTDADGGDANE